MKIKILFWVRVSLSKWGPGWTPSRVSGSHCNYRNCVYNVYMGLSEHLLKEQPQTPELSFWTRGKPWL